MSTISQSARRPATRPTLRALVYDDFVLELPLRPGLHAAAPRKH